MRISQHRTWLLLPVVGCFVLGCEQTNEVVTEGKPLADPFQVSAADYSTNYFFVDTSYLALYEPYFLNDPPVLYSAKRILDMEVWVSRVGSIPDPNEIRAKAYVLLPPYNGGYPDSLRKGYSVAGDVEEYPFVRLEPSEFELIANGWVGIVRIDHRFDDYQAIAVAYSQADGAQFGEFARNVTFDSAFFASGTPLLLKLLKPMNLFAVGPAYNVPWHMLVKSIYPIGYSGVISTLFHLDVFQEIDGNLGQNSVQGQPLLAVLGIDRRLWDGSPSAGGDGVFDYVPGQTIDQNKGDIILPYVRPFDNGIWRYFASIGQFLNSNSSLLLPQLYDTTKTALNLRSTYVLKGSTLH
jgi:hypothetical protein